MPDSEPNRHDATTALGILLAEFQTTAERAAQMLAHELGWSPDVAERFVFSTAVETVGLLVELHAQAVARGLTTSEFRSLVAMKIKRLPD